MGGSIDNWFKDHEDNLLGDSLDDEQVEQGDPWD